MPLTTAQMIFDEKDLSTLIDALDDLVLEYDQNLALGFSGYADDRIYALQLKERIDNHLTKLRGSTA